VTRLTAGAPPAGVVTLTPGLAFGSVYVVVDVNGYYR